ncbi:surfeit locus protein 6 isoform X2 [Sagmatias obliquidens]|uniref:surfeit locus protein 6 isoform X2 n=1 Tax=Sagmatias obliquidens TaxID=3371155 RepID=UPI000F43FDF1|nr:surfeit locus protein 6 isoform X2 [Lagenorhynchus obliquidens]
MVALPLGIVNRLSQPSTPGGKTAGKTQVSEAAGPPKKKRKRAQKKFREREEKAAEPKAQAPAEKSQARTPVAAKEREDEAPSSTGAPAGEGGGQGRLGSATDTKVGLSGHNGTIRSCETSRRARFQRTDHGAPVGGPAGEPGSLFALDVLRQRLREKIREARGQGSAKELSPAALEKRRRRKQERDRKKRKRRELRAKERAAEALEGVEATEPPPEAPHEEAQAQSGLLFNKVEVSEEEPGSKAQRRKEKRQKLKGNLTPLTGRNYRQLLERLQARQARLEELRDQDAGQARELEAKMQWTNLLYKAEGVKIRDDEHLLQEALKRKEKRRAQRQRAWEKRTAHVLGKMQQRQDRRRQNLRKKKAARAERRLEKARKKGRILPQDLERAGLV